MVSKGAFVVCLICLISISCIDAQRDGRRRTNRRKPTTEIPPPPEVDPEEENPGKSDGESEELPTVKASQAPSEPETSAPPLNKDSKNQAGTQFLVPRGTRKPRRMPTRGKGEGISRPTLPSFARRGSPRSRQKIEDDSQKNGIDSVVPSSTSTTAKPARGSSTSTRRRNNDNNSNSAPAASLDTESSDGNQKKRFGGGSTRRPSRGSRRGTTAPPL